MQSPLLSAESVLVTGGDENVCSLTAYFLNRRKYAIPADNAKIIAPPTIIMITVNQSGNAAKPDSATEWADEEEGFLVGTADWIVTVEIEYATDPITVAAEVLSSARNDVDMLFSVLVKFPCSTSRAILACKFSTILLVSSLSEPYCDDGI
jgi:hypothetical protein